MYALPFAVLLAAIFADREEAPPPQKPQPSPGPEGFGALSRAEMVTGYGALSRAEMVAFGADPQHPLLGDVSSAAIALQAIAGRNIGHRNVDLEQTGKETVTITALIPEHNIVAAKQIDDEAKRLARQADVLVQGPFPGEKFRLWKNAVRPLQGPHAAQWHFFGKGGAFGALSRAQMVEGYGAQPGSWEAAWYGVWYGADPTTAQIEAINSQVMKIVKRVLGWAVATKGPKLISLNSQRDALIKQGVPPNSPQVTALEQKAFSILQGAGLRPSSPEYQTLRNLGAQRDKLLLQQAGQA